MTLRVLVIGAVGSTKTTIDCLLRHGIAIHGILGHEPEDVTTVSGWVDLRSLAASNDVPFFGFQKINQDEAYNWALAKQPDIIFAVGFSQLLGRKWLDLPSLGCIGFHPTCLPRGRGRAPLAWIVLEERCGGATFFLMQEGADDGPIFAQELFTLSSSDDAETVGKEVQRSITIALDRWLPELRSGKWDPKPQDESKATYYGIRRPEDGIIDWSNSAREIDRLVKASTRPHPGAYSYANGEKIIVWESEIETDAKIRGVTGRVLIKRDEQYLIQCGDGMLWLKSITSSGPLRVGDKLGYSLQDEIFRLWNAIGDLQNVERLSGRPSRGR